MNTDSVLHNKHGVITLPHTGRHYFPVPSCPYSRPSPYREPHRAASLLPSATWHRMDTPENALRGHTKALLRSASQRYMIGVEEPRRRWDSKKKRQEGSGAKAWVEHTNILHETTARTATLPSLGPGDRLQRPTRRLPLPESARKHGIAPSTWSLHHHPRLRNAKYSTKKHSKRSREHHSRQRPHRTCTQTRLSRSYTSHILVR